MQGVLEGLRVLDFTRVLAGPFATRLLGDLGAEVIKIQSGMTAKGTESFNSAYFRTWNRNKRSITLNMSHPEVRDIVLRLTAVSDVVMENFSSRVMSNWGLEYGDLRKVKPDLIMLSMSAAGHTGPWKDLVAFGPTIHALSGFTYLTSFEEGSPVGVGYSYADVISGLYAVLAVLAALECRERSGSGQYIDLSEYEAMCTLLGPTFLGALAKGRNVVPEGNSPGYIPAAPYGCYRCLGEGRWCVIAVFEDTQWESLCKVMGNPSWTKEGRFSTLPLRKANARYLDELLQEWTSSETAERLVRVLQEAGVPAGLVQNAEDLARDPQLISRNFFVKMGHPLHGSEMADGLPMKLQGARPHPWRAAPILGEGNRYVFLEILGFTESQFRAYVDKGVIS